MSVTVETRQTQVEQIDGEGKYQISKDPNEHYGYGSRHLNWSEDYQITGDPFALPSKLVDHLNAFFPDMQRVTFRPAQFRDGSLSAAELDYIPGPIVYSYYGEDSDYFDFDGHIFYFGCKVEREGKHTKDNFYLNIQDKGSLRVVKNKLEFVQSHNRNSTLSISTFGRAAFQNYPGSMAGFIETHGDKPGELIASGLEFINRFVAEQGYPLWRKYQES